MRGCGGDACPSLSPSVLSPGLPPFAAAAGPRENLIQEEETAVENVWLIAALWIGLALAASLLSVWLTISVALTEIVVGAIAGNVIHLQLTDWINWLAGFGAILLTFLAGVEIDYAVIKRNFWSTMCIGLMGFFAPYLGVLFFAHLLSDGLGHKRRSPEFRCPPPPWPSCMR